MSLTWTASMDNVGVDLYNIFRCAGDCTPTSIIGTTAQTSYTDTNLAPSTQYTYQLSAADASGNVSSRTNVFTGITHDTDDSGSGDGSGGGSGSGCFITTSLQHKIKSGLCSTASGWPNWADVHRRGHCRHRHRLCSQIHSLKRTWGKHPDRPVS